VRVIWENKFSGLGARGVEEDQSGARGHKITRRIYIVSWLSKARVISGGLAVLVGGQVFTFDIRL
jgi:hypothetical protein